MVNRKLLSIIFPLVLGCGCSPLNHNYYENKFVIDGHSICLSPEEYVDLELVESENGEEIAWFSIMFPKENIRVYGGYPAISQGPAVYLSTFDRKPRKYAEYPGYYVWENQGGGVAFSDVDNPWSFSGNYIYVLCENFGQKCSRMFSLSPGFYLFYDIIDFDVRNFYEVDRKTLNAVKGYFKTCE